MSRKIIAVLAGLAMILGAAPVAAADDGPSGPSLWTVHPYPDDSPGLGYPNWDDGWKAAQEQQQQTGQYTWIQDQYGNYNPPFSGAGTP